MKLEFSASKSNSTKVYPFDFVSALVSDDRKWLVDWVPLLKSILTERQIESNNIVARKFHNTLVEINLEMAKKTLLNKVALSGGTFQNKLLTEGSISILKKNGFQPYWHQRVPPNDGGICLGQIMAAQFTSFKEN